MRKLICRVIGHKGTEWEQNFNYGWVRSINCLRCGAHTDDPPSPGSPG